MSDTVKNQKYYVSRNGAGNHDGSSWNNAFTNLEWKEFRNTHNMQNCNIHFNKDVFDKKRPEGE